MGAIFFIAAAILFFLGAVGATIIPAPASWGLVLLALGLACGNRWPLKGGGP